MSDWSSFDAFGDGKADQQPKSPVSASGSGPGAAPSTMDDLFGDFGTISTAPASTTTPQLKSQPSNSTPWDVFDAFDPLAAPKPPSNASQPPVPLAASSSTSKDLFALFGGDDTTQIGGTSPALRSSTASDRPSLSGIPSNSNMDAFADFGAPISSPQTSSSSLPQISSSAKSLSIGQKSPVVASPSFAAEPSTTGFTDVSFAAFETDFQPPASSPIVVNSSPAIVSSNNSGFAAFDDFPAPSGSGFDDFAGFEGKPSKSASAPSPSPVAAPAPSKPPAAKEMPSPSVSKASSSASASSGPFSFAFDESILRKPAEARESLAFAWLYNCEAAVKALAKDQTKPIQQGLETTLLKLLTMDSPAPTLPAARTMARIYYLLYTKGDRRTVFDTVASLQTTLSPTAKGAPQPSQQTKLAVTYLLGMLSLNFGEGVGSLFASTATILAKLAKAGNDNVLHCEAFYGLSRAIEGSGRAVSEASAKEVIKVVRDGVRDKSIAVRTSAVECLDSLLKSTPHGRPAKLDDFDALLLPLVKYTLEGSTYTLRRSVAALIGTIAAFGLLPPPVDPKKKGNEPPSTRPLMSLPEVLSFLAQYLFKYTAPAVRIGIIQGYAAFFRQLGQAGVEANYADIVGHIIDLSCNPKLCTSRIATKGTRDWCIYLLRNVLSKMLTEPGQNQAIRILTELWLKRWPPASGQQGPQKAALVTVLQEVASLLNDVGPAAMNVAEVVEPLGNLLNHLSRSVNAAVCWTLRSVCLSAPHNIPKLISRIVPWLKKEVANLTPDQPDRIKRFRGYALALGSLISVVPYRPLYVSFELCAKVLALAVHLLKQAGQSKSPRLVGIQGEVSWVLVASLMCLGPDFCKVHLAQIVGYWKAHFEKYGRDRAWLRNEAEKEMVLQVTNAALAALQAFLTFNGKVLLGSELDKRISTWLNDFQGALDSGARRKPAVPAGKDEMDDELFERECHIRARIFRCCSLLFQLGSFEPTITLMASAVQVLTPSDPAEAKCTSYVKGLSMEIASNVATEDRGVNRGILRDVDVQTIEDQAEGFASGAAENDPYAMFLRKVDAAQVDPRRVESLQTPAADTDMVDAAVDVFGQLFVAVGSSGQEKLLDDILRSLRKAPKGQSDAALTNALAATFSALKHAVAKQGNVVTGRVPDMLRELILLGLFNESPAIRALASENIGRLAQVNNSNAFTNALTQHLVQSIVNVREPSTRAGAALALGSIQSYGGSLTGMTQLKSGFSILQSLATDSHPTVHTWALVGMLMTVDGSGLMFSSLVQPTLDLLFGALASDAHHTGASIESNEFIGPILARLLSATLNVMGPELATKSKGIRDMCFALYEDMRSVADPFIAVEAMKCAQQFLLFDPAHLDSGTLVPYIQALLAQDIRSQIRVLRKSCVTCLYQMAKRNPQKLLEQAESLEEQLFGLLDTEGEATVRDEIKDVLREIIHFSAASTPSRWLDLCKRILSTTSVAAVRQASSAGAAPQPAGEGGGGDDDSSMLEGGGAEGGMPVESVSSISAAITLMPRWRTHLFALACVRQLVDEIIRSGRHEHVELASARAWDQARGSHSDLFIYRIGDVVRVAFSAATAPVQDLRLSGLDLLQDVLEQFSSVQDPDFEGHSLLEQYQAQISSALSPALANEAVAEVASAACRVSAVYVASGVNQDLSTLSRVLRLLQELLTKIAADKSEASDPQPHASTMVKLAVQSAWARLAISTTTQEHLKPMVQPHIATLSRLWFKTLREYGRLSLENDVLRSLGGFPLAIDIGSSLTYLEAMRNIVLPFYNDAWLFILRALTASMDDERSMEAVLQQPDGSEVDISDVFTILCGLCLRAISTDDSITRGAHVDRREDVIKYCLKALGSLSEAGGSGRSFLSQEFALNDTLAVLDRTVDTVAKVRVAVASTIQDIVAKSGDEISGKEPSDASQSRFLKIFLNLLAHNMAGFASKSRKYEGVSEEAVIGAISAFSLWLSKLPSATGWTVFPLWSSTILAALLFECSAEGRMRLLVSLATVAKTIGQDETYQPALQSLVDQVVGLMSNPAPATSLEDYRGTLLRVMSILFVTAPLQARSDGVTKSVVACVESCLAAPGKDAIAPCLQFMNAAFLLAQNTDAETSRTGKIYIRQLVPSLIAAVTSRARRVYVDAIADAGSVHLEAFAQVASIPVRVMSTEQEAALYLRVVVLVLIDLLAPPSTVGEDSYHPTFVSPQSRQLHASVVQALLRLAVEDPARFRTVVDSFDVVQKTKLQGALAGGQRKPTIALKSFA